MFILTIFAVKKCMQIEVKPDKCVDSRYGKCYLSFMVCVVLALRTLLVL
jgi:hypothetical protein